MVMRKTFTRRWQTLALAASVATLSVGCESTTTPDPTTGDDPATVAEDIDARFGGFETTDEPAGFDEEYLLEAGEQPVNDEMAADPVVEDLAARDDVVAYAVRLTWGYLERDSSNANDPVDWSGSAVVDTGAVVGRRTILFEPLQGDHVVRPRDSRRVIEWVSTTTVHFDGLQVVVLDPTGDDAEGTLTIDMPLYSATFSFGDLTELDVMAVVDDAGHQVRVQAREIVRPDGPAFCRRGWLAGRWMQDDRPASAPHGIEGHFMGHWTNDEGTVTGTLRGFYGMNRRGHRVLFGKLISDGGEFEALMRGTWSRGPGSAGHGPFLARLYDEDRATIGGVRGTWQRRERGEGSFSGGWALLCPDAGDIEIDETIFDVETDR